mmetsp:Transcript_36125/g.61075  ORF Transcript_36125/g.61075 Transcript_36125/m.61075 type:complete len:291 (-) Transcript_36125:221-1093(-)
MSGNKRKRGELERDDGEDKAKKKCSKRTEEEDSSDGSDSDSSDEEFTFRVNKKAMQKLSQTKEADRKEEGDLDEDFPEPEYKRARRKAREEEEKKRHRQEGPGGQTISLDDDEKDSSSRSMNVPQEDDVLSGDEDTNDKDIIHADPEFLKSVASIRQQRLQIAPETRDSSFEFSIEQNVSLIDDDDEDEDEEDADEIVDREVALRIAEHQRQNEAQSENEIRITLKPGEGRELKIKVFKDSQFGEVIKRMRQHFRVNQVKLQFDGETISNNQTPMDLDMEDDDIVDMYMN